MVWHAECYSVRVRLFAITRPGLITISLLVATLWSVLLANAAQQRYIQVESTRLRQARNTRRIQRSSQPRLLPSLPKQPSV